MGAHLIEPGNTPASFDAALAHGVDMIEFDVLPERMDDPGASRLLLAHNYAHIDGAITLAEGLAHLASPPFADVGLNVDVKLPGYEDRVVAALREHGLVERALISTSWMRALVRFRELEPGLRLGWSVPRLRRDYTESWYTKLPAYVGKHYLRARLPQAAGRHLAAGRCDAVMSHWRLVSPRLLRVVRESGGELYVWTVDEAVRIGRLERLGVTGIITNDPRLFGQPPSAQVAAE